MSNNDVGPLAQYQVTRSAASSVFIKLQKKAGNLEQPHSWKHPKENGALLYSVADELIFITAIYIILPSVNYLNKSFYSY